MKLSTEMTLSQSLDDLKQGPSDYALTEVKLQWLGEKT